MEQASSAFSTGVPALAAIPQLAGNSRLGFQPVASTSRWGFSFSISSNTLGLSTSLYDGDAGSRSTGKERDSESGNDYFGARYYASSMGRFMSPDWAAKVAPVPYAKLDDPQSLNLYSYVLNNPLSRVDADGHWPTDIHNQIIDRAFPGLSNAQRQILKNASAAMDQCIACQSHGNAYQHAMRAPGENIDKAKSDTQNFINGKESAATNAMNASKTTSASGLNKDALTAVGDAMHTESDKTSPAHTDAQGNPREWIIMDFQEHNKEESTISPAQMDSAVKAEQQVFQKSFGADITKQAITPPKKDQQ
jgi:RHS repeat-associated protein